MDMTTAEGGGFLRLIKAIRPAMARELGVDAF
jgi:hypothetical protein